MIVKDDLSKAYDRFKWIYLMLVLLQFGFHIHIVSWIISCVISVSYAVLINVSATPFFRAIQGLEKDATYLSYSSYYWLRGYDDLYGNGWPPTDSTSSK